jgi:mRNA interferase YafQ
VATGDGPQRQPRTIVTAKQFDKDTKKVRLRGKDMARLLSVVDAMRNRQQLEPRHRDHALAGHWKGYRECHIGPDWLLIYSLDDTTVYLARTGTHSDLFG